MEKTHPENKTVILAGATGDLGFRIASYLIEAGASVVAPVRANSITTKADILQNKGVNIVNIDFNNNAQLTEVCKGGTCVVSALNGLEDVIIGVQTQLLQAAIDAGVPRFIPSDYCIDYTKLPKGTNRNLDLRKHFNEVLDNAPIAATSVLNGMFTGLLTGQAPVVLFGMNRVVYWERADQKLDFTTIDNTAEFTALAALDDSSPRYFRIAGDVLDAEGLANAAGDATGKEFKLLKAGSLKRLRMMINFTRTVFPNKKEVFPPWQGMQYLHNMFSGEPKLYPLNNNRYPGIYWTSVKEVLAKRKS